MSVSSYLVLRSALLLSATITENIAREGYPARFLRFNADSLVTTEETIHHRLRSSQAVIYPSALKIFFPHARARKRESSRLVSRKICRDIFVLKSTPDAN